MADDYADRIVLVCGATGTQGGAVARQLLDCGFPVRALTRNPQAQAARALADAGAEVVGGDFADRSALDRAVEGAYGVYSVLSFHEEGTDAERRNGCAVAEASARAGVAHFVYSSVGGADRETGISFHDSKFAIEDRILELGLPFTIFRPSFYMRNWREVWPHILSGVVPWPLGPDTALQQLAVEDLAVFAAKAFVEPQRWLGRTVELASDELTMTQVADAFGRVLGRPVRYEQVDMDTFIEIMRGATGLELDHNLVRMFRWFDTDGFHADLTDLRAEYPALTSLEEFLRCSEWATEPAPVSGGHDNLQKRG